jgi:DNA-directed RNA polymerase specialized sigma24 family protein
MISNGIVSERKRMRELLRRWGMCGDMCREKSRRLKEFKSLSGDAEPSEQYLSTVEALNRGCQADFAFGRAMTELVNRLSPRLQTVLWMRYASNSSFLRVALRLNCSADHAKRLERQAVDALIAMPGCEELQKELCS